jgi:hypothetical protein
MLMQLDVVWHVRTKPSKLVNTLAHVIVVIVFGGNVHHQNSKGNQHAWCGCASSIFGFHASATAEVDRGAECIAVFAL